MANNNKLKKKNGNINIKNKRAEFDIWSLTATLLELC